MYIVIVDIILHGNVSIVISYSVFTYFITYPFVFTGCLSPGQIYNVNIGHEKKQRTVKPTNEMRWSG